MIGSSKVSQIAIQEANDLVRAEQKNKKEGLFVPIPSCEGLVVKGFHLEVVLPHDYVLPWLFR